MSLETHAMPTSDLVKGVCYKKVINETGRLMDEEERTVGRFIRLDEQRDWPGRMVKVALFANPYGDPNKEWDYHGLEAKFMSVNCPPPPSGGRRRNTRTHKNRGRGRKTRSRR